MKITEITADVPTIIIILNANSENDIIYIFPRRGHLKSTLHSATGSRQKPTLVWSGHHCQQLGYLPAELDKLESMAVVVEGETMELYAIEAVLKIECKPRAPIVS